MKNRKNIMMVVSVLFLVIVLALVSSYALFTFNITKNVDFKVTIGNLELSIRDTMTEDKFIMENVVPIKDQVALSQDGYTFTITNTGTIDSYYSIYLDDILLNNDLDSLNNNFIRFQILNHTTNDDVIDSLSNYPDIDRVLVNGYLKRGESITYTLRMWVDYNAGNEAQNKYFAVQVRVDGQQQNAITYKDSVLNGTDPLLTDNLIPVTIIEDGTVRKADTTSKWYSYQEKNWANAVVLKDSSVSYENNEVIPEENIESYFVWIPRYKYKIFNEGNYTGLTNFETTTPKAIEIIFENKNTQLSTGNTVDEYLTHPAFQAFDTNGIWVGKFETGYEGASSTESAQINSSDSSKIIIKPNVYSWRGITVGNAFEASYNYLRSEESHMMKNTEWGAVAYLTNSNYGRCNDGICSEVRINNNSSYITGYAGTEEPTLGYNNGTSVSGNRVEGTIPKVDGTYTVNYLNSKSIVASTTGNKSGIYDMSGGAWEYVMGYTTSASTIGGASGITSLHSDFFTSSNWNKYYDKYTFPVITDYNNRILGDATGEMGPFGSESDPDNNTRYKSSWYKDLAYFVFSSEPWFMRGGYWLGGSCAGSFAFGTNTGVISMADSFRVVLTP